jgi:hypothetical protein
MGLMERQLQEDGEEVERDVQQLGLEGPGHAAPTLAP